MSFKVSATGGQGLSGVPMDGGIALSYYDAANGQVTIATRSGDGSVATAAAADIPEGSAEGSGAATGLAARSRGVGRRDLVGRRRGRQVRDRRPWFAEAGRHRHVDGGRGVPVDHRERGRLGDLPRLVRDDGGGPARRRVRGVRGRSVRRAQPHADRPDHPAVAVAGRMHPRSGRLRHGGRAGHRVHRGRLHPGHRRRVVLRSSSTTATRARSTTSRSSPAKNRPATPSSRATS